MSVMVRACLKSVGLTLRLIQQRSFVMNRLLQLFKLDVCVPMFVDKVEYRRSHHTYVQFFFFNSLIWLLMSNRKSREKHVYTYLSIYVTSCQERVRTTLGECKCLIQSACFVQIWKNCSLAFSKVPSVTKLVFIVKLSLPLFPHGITIFFTFHIYYRRILPSSFIFCNGILQSFQALLCANDSVVICENLTHQESNH